MIQRIEQGKPEFLLSEGVGRMLRYSAFKVCVILSSRATSQSVTKVYMDDSAPVLVGDNVTDLSGLRG